MALVSSPILRFCGALEDDHTKEDSSEDSSYENFGFKSTVIHEYIVCGWLFWVLSFYFSLYFDIDNQGFKFCIYYHQYLLLLFTLIGL